MLSDKNEGSARLLDLLQECSAKFGPATRMRTIAVLARVMLLGPSPIRFIAAGLDASDAAVRYDLKRLGNTDRHGRPGLRMVNETVDRVTGEVTYCLTKLGQETLDAILRHLQPSPK